jgi:hypothetical protein
MQPLPSSRISDEPMAKPVELLLVARQHESITSNGTKCTEKTGTWEAPPDESSLTHIF